MHYPSHMLSKFGQIELETVRGPYVYFHVTAPGNAISDQTYFKVSPILT